MNKGRLAKYSLWQFRWMLENGVMDIVQPDMNYNGGLIRAKRVARIAEKLGKVITPHNTQTGVSSVNILQFASCTKNIGPYMEYPWRAPQDATRSQFQAYADLLVKVGSIDNAPRNAPSVNFRGLFRRQQVLRPVQMRTAVSGVTGRFVLVNGNRRPQSAGRGRKLHRPKARDAVEIHRSPSAKNRQVDHRLA